MFDKLLPIGWQIKRVIGLVSCSTGIIEPFPIRLKTKKISNACGTVSSSWITRHDIGCEVGMIENNCLFSLRVTKMASIHDYLTRERFCT